MEFILMSIKILAALIVFILLIMLAVKVNEGKFKEINNNKLIKILERTQLSKDVSLQIIKIAGRGYILSVSSSKTELIKELTEDEVNEIELKKQLQIDKNNEALKSVFISSKSFLNKLKKRKKSYEN